MSKIIKVLLMTFVIIMCIGCTKKEDNILSDEKKVYQSYIKSLKKVNKPSDDLPFDIDIKYDKITKNEVRYQVIIDNPKEELKNISALVIHNKQTDDVFPTTGIFEKKQSLIPGKKPKGIILVGYIPYNKDVKKLNCKIKVMIRYTLKEKSKTVYYVTKKAGNK